MSRMRHEAAIMSAECMTAKLQQTIDELQLRLARAKVDFGKAYNAAYYEALEALKDKDAKQ